MANFSFYINRMYVKKNGRSAIYIIATVKGEQLKINTSIEVEPNLWDSEKNHIKGNSKDIKDQNLILKNCAARLTNIFVKYRLREKELTPELLLKEYDNPSSGIDFLDFYEKELEAQKIDIALNSYKHRCTTLKNLKDFKKTLSFSELDKEFLEEFSRFCKRKGNGQNTINKNLNNIRIFVNKAIEREYMELSPFLKLKMKKVQTEIVYLEESELFAFIDAYKNRLFSDKIHQTLRNYLFSCNTGLRVSDFKALTHDNIIGNVLVIKPQKTKETGKIVRIPLSKGALVLIKDEGSKIGVVFRTSSEQKMNEHLKIIAHKCNVKKDISFHSARHTFATSFYRLTGRLVELQKLLGHADIKQTLVYTHVVTSDIEEKMKVMDQLWQ